MTFNQAKDLIHTFSNVVGKTYKGKRIDGFVIIPNMPLILDNILRHAIATKNDTTGFEDFDDFLVIGLLEMDRFKSIGHLQYEHVNVILTALDDEL